jgi:hypothetical protein
MEYKDIKINNIQLYNENILKYKKKSIEFISNEVNVKYSISELNNIFYLKIKIDNDLRKFIENIENKNIELLDINKIFYKSQLNYDILTTRISNYKDNLQLKVFSETDSLKTIYDIKPDDKIICKIKVSKIWKSFRNNNTQYGCIFYISEILCV